MKNFKSKAAVSFIQVKFEVFKVEGESINYESSKGLSIVIDFDCKI
jgi:hypothetical protein